MKTISSTLLMTSALALCACGGGSSGNGGNGGGGGQNRAPVFTSASSASVSENTSGTVYTARASDADGDRLSYGIAAGDDAALFVIDPTSGAVRFAVAPDYEWPRDANGDNVYQFTLTVSDGRATARQAISVSVTNLAGRVSTRRVATGFSQPLFLLGRGDDTDRVIVVQKGGLARVLNPLTGAIESTPFLDVRSEISTDNERGLLGMALAPDFEDSGTVYAFLTAKNGDLQVRRFTSGTNGVGAASGEIIISIPHPLANHNGGWIDFDADGNLIIATGDGGGAGDPSNNAQNRNSLLGKMLRIDPRSDAFPTDPNRNYAIPAGNPFARSGGAPEIWHMGLRNPHRNSFDRDTGNLYIADVGQEGWEEINLVRPTDPGLNFGWKILEGTRPYAGGSTIGLTMPVLQIEHGTGAQQGRSITGGYVYRGPVTTLRGHYVFGDFMNARLWSIPASQFVQGVTLTATALTSRTTAFAPASGTIGSITSFGTDGRNNLYIVDYDGEVFLITEVDEGS